MAIRTATIREIHKGSIKRVRTRSSSITLEKDNQMARFGFLNWLLSLALILAISLGIWCSFQVAMVGRELNSLIARENMLKKENKTLNLELSKLTSQKRLEKLGKRLGLNPPSIEQKIRLNE